MKEVAKDNVLNTYIYCLHKTKSEKFNNRQCNKIVENIQKKYIIDNDIIKDCDAIKKLKQKYNKLKMAQNDILNFENKERSSDFTFANNIQRIYHTIETEKMNAADMYSMMSALKTQINIVKRDESNNSRRLTHYKKVFKDQGGVEELETLKKLLLSLGVNIYE